jgi:hypothetical protein
VSNYGWFATIDNLANGDILKFDSVTKLPLLTCLTKMSLESDKSIEREKEQRKNKRK